jgi:hypothetical protein
MKFRTLALVLLAAAALPVLAYAMSPMHPELGAKLLGKNEVPKASPSGHGIVNLTLNAGKGSVCWTFAGINGIGTPLVAHIHKAPVGKAGPVVVPLSGAYKTKGCTKAPKRMIAAIETHPNAYYVNVHTKKYPAGAIRGQLVAGMVHT